jgi:hypothetical protein
MALLTIVPLVRTGIDAAGGAAAAAGGDRFPNTGKEFFCISNASGSPVNVTFETTVTVDDQAVADLVVAVADGKSLLIGPFPIFEFSEEVNVSYADETSLTVQAIRMTPGV